MPTSAIITYSTNPIRPALPQSEHPAVTRPVRLAASATYARGAILGEKIGNNEVQTVTPPGSGTFTTTFGGQTTSGVAFNATAATYQAALEALSTVGSGNVAVTGGGGSAFVVTFQNDLGYTDVAAMTVSSGSVAVTTAGSAGTPGEFAAYSPSASNGTQTPRCVLPFACATDASGNITYGDSATGGEFGEEYDETWAYFGGSFETDDVTGLTEAIVTALGGRIVSGSIAGGGIFKF